MNNTFPVPIPTYSRCPFLHSKPAYRCPFLQLVGAHKGTILYILGGYAL